MRDEEKDILSAKLACGFSCSARLKCPDLAKYCCKRIDESLLVPRRCDRPCRPISLDRPGFDQYIMEISNGGP